MSNKYSCPLSIRAFLAGVLAIALSSCASWRQTEAPEPAPCRETLLDAGWLFHLGDFLSGDAIAAPDFDDQRWQPVQLPHDYVLDGRYRYSKDKLNQNHGFLPLSPAWYRKHLVIPQSDAGKTLRLDFGGAFRDSTVWLNGRFLGRHASGYTPFSYDITGVAKPGAENVITVRVDPREFEGHWYEGGGIYRHVYLTALAPLHVAQWGTSVVSKVPDGNEGRDSEGDLTLQTTVENNGAVSANCGVVSEIVGPDGNSVATRRDETTVAADGRRDVVQRTVVQHPKLWSPESPSLYQLRTMILQDGKLVDSTTTTFGIRTIRFDADKGFFLNGRRVEIQGVANHQDFPGTGIAMPDSLQFWRVEQLKKVGCNGWRTAHNPPTEAVLDACDRLGMLVMDENRHLGESYRHHSLTGTTYTNLSDLAVMIQRDRNHPSVILWSMCNEEGLRGKPEGRRIFAAMKKMTRRYDATRPITSAINGSWLTNGINDEDVIGINYHERDYDNVHRANPRVPMFGSETANIKTTRGVYVSDPANGWVGSYNLFGDKLPAMFSSGKNGWTTVASRPFMAGSYTWTGFDYKGEPNPYAWPDVANHTGLLDSCGFPKDKFYYYQSCWTDKPMVHLMPMTWNWPGREGQNIRVAAFSNAHRIELFLNGQSLGTKELTRGDHVEWEVPYQPGRLLAKAYTNEKTVATDVEETTGTPARLQLAPERTRLQADGEDAVVVPVSILDDKGRVVPGAANRVTFHLAGGGRILGVGNGDPADHDPDRANQRNAFHGHCIVVLQAGLRPSAMRLTATSPGLAPVTINFKAE